MKSFSTLSHDDSSAGVRPSPATVRRAPAAARFVLGLLARIRYGSLTVTLPDGSTAVFGATEGRGAADGPGAASLRISDWRVFREVLASGDIGFGESYMRGDWSTPDPAALLRVLTANRRQIEAAVYGRWWGQLLHRLRHLLRRNTRGQARRNIAAHYDLGNPFYRLWLDPSMTYSSALFDGDAGRSLEQAQAAKYDRVLQRIETRPGERVLEIGCGWGGFAERAARRGLHVTGLTLSSEQLAHATERLAAAGLGERAEFRLQDYRDTAGSFDAVASIEMFEAVGEAYWPDYFACVARNLKPGGRAVIQTIVIADALFEQYRAGTDFIQQYIFPGGMLPTVGIFEAQAAQAGLRVLDRHAFGADYARTLAAWRKAFMARLPEVRAQGFDEPFVRMWEFYLAYCEAGFAERNIDVLQFTLQRPA